MNLFKKFTIVFSLIVVLVFGVSSVQNSAEAASYPISNWEFYTTIKSSTTVERVAVLGASLLISNYVLAPYTGVKTLVQFAVGVYAITRGQNLWTTTKVYRKFAEIGKPLKPLAAQQNRISYYIDSGRTKLAGTNTLTYYSSWY